MKGQPKPGTCCSLYFVHSASLYTVGTLDTARARPVTVASFLPISREPAPCSAQVPGGRQFNCSLRRLSPMKALQDQPTAKQSVTWAAEQVSALRVQSKAWQPAPWRRLRHSSSRTHSRTSVLTPGCAALCFQEHRAACTQSSRPRSSICG